MENMYSSIHFTEIELFACEKLSSQQHEWDNTVQYLKYIYGDRLAFQNRDTGEKTFDSAARLKETSLPSYV